MSGSGGQIRQRPNGLWEGRYVGADHRRHSIYARTKAEAQSKMRAALVAADNGIRPIRGRETVAGWLEDWLTASVAQRCRPRTLDSYRETCARYIVPAIGDVPLSKLEARDIQRMMAGLSRRGLSPSTVRYAHAVLRISLNRALKAGRVLRNVAAMVDPPARAAREIRPLTADQVRTLLANIDGDRLATLYMVAVGTGLRQGELLGLRWQDIDLDNGTLTVRHALALRTRELVEPKTESSRRTLRLGVEVLGALREQRRSQLGERLAAGRHWADLDYVFATPGGQPLDSSNVLHSFQRTLARIGLPRQRFHDLRHAAAILMLEQGEELGVVSKVLGHSTIGTTADVYAHLTPAMSQRAADRMDAILRRTAGA